MLSTAILPLCVVFRLIRVTVPLRTLETKTCARFPTSLTVRSQGPSSSVLSVRVPTCFPLRSMIRSEVCPIVWQVPSVVGRLPTSTNPAFKAPSAVVIPRGGVPPKNKDAGPPLCLICTIVVPVPWRPELLLKFETRTSPARSGPPGGNPSGTNATPYGFPSPLPESVETEITGDPEGGMIGELPPSAENADVANEISRPTP